jgi:hypothetical protein
MIDYRTHPNTGGHPDPESHLSRDEPNAAPSIITAPFPDDGIQYVDIDGTGSTSGFDNGPVLQGWSSG